ncbi:MAG TPA: glycosyltransferase [Gemmataceae bacterium]|nr:glycosyltransferase [Gemmataceae bacterium]
MILRIARRIKRLLRPSPPLQIETTSWPVDSLPVDADWTLVKPWPNFKDIPSPQENDRLEIFLFLQICYLGGVWEATKDLVHQLVKVNQERGRLRLTLGIHQDQTDTESLESLGDDLSIVRIRMNPITRDSIVAMLGHRPKWLNEPVPGFCFFSGGAEAAIRADAWFGLLDRFPLPLMPLRPYGVLIYDMLQKYVPQNFGPPDCGFFRWCREGMKPTARAARFVTVMTPQVQRDVLEEYQLEEHRVRLLPYGFDAHRRFGAVHPEAVPVPRVPFILFVANAAIHKGAGTLLKAFGKLRQSGLQNLPPLVLCGTDTDRFSRNFKGDADHPNGPIIRKLVLELGLEEGIDVVFLGFVTEAQLRHLYETCSAVVLASKHDMGTLCLVEATYFGKPIICSRYPSNEFICNRYSIEARFFAIDDSEALAELLREFILAPPKSLSAEDLASVRHRLANPELCTPRYAYDCLVELAEEGRREKMTTLSRVA